LEKLDKVSDIKNQDFIVFGQPLIEQPEIDEVVDSLQKSWLGTGPKVKQFEIQFAQYKGMPYSAALNSCTAGLHLSLLSLGLKAGDEVITTPLTFCATVNTIIHSGALPVLADIDPTTGNISPQEIESKITSKTKAIIPVHFAGRACDMDSIIHLSLKYNLSVIEDCAHAIETEYHGKKAGTIGDIGVFSFYTTKNVVTGEGGMVISRDEKKISFIKTLALHGMSYDAWQRFSDKGYKHYHIIEAGYKYNMMDIQAALGIHQLRRVGKNWKKREAIWEMYLKELLELPIGLPVPVEPNTRHAYHLFTILVDEDKTGISRDRFLQEMTDRKIGVGVHYLSIPEHPYYQKNYRWNIDDFPYAKRVGRQTVSLPISPKLSQQEIQQIVTAVKQILKKG
jgi:dTDP-4-amino-4,6-dideoxygalactose transaminase